MSSSIQNLAIGIRGVYYADINSDVWTRIENVVEGSIAFTFTDPTETSLNVEDKADPIATLRMKDTPDRIDLSFYNLSVEELAVILGGTAGGETYSKTWDSPTSLPSISKRFRIVTEPFNNYYVIYTIENAQVLAKPAGAPSKKQAEQINVSLLIQAAANAAGTTISPYNKRINHEYVPYNLTVDDTAGTLAFTIMTGAITDYEYSITIGGAETFTACTTNPITGISGAVAVGAAGVRAEVGSSSPQKASAIAEKAFTA